MLSGLTSVSSTMFPAISGIIAPSADEMSNAYEKMQLDRTVKVDGYHTELFDMHLQKDRKRYNDLMVDLTRKIQLKSVRITAHERKTLPRKDGSAGWFNYIEWMEFRLEERPIATVPSSKTGE